MLRTALGVLVALAALWGAPAAADDNDYAITVSFDPTDQNWTGLTITNVGQQPFHLQQVVLNSRADCTFVPFKLALLGLSTQAETLPTLAGLASLVLGSAGLDTGYLMLPNSPVLEKMVAPESSATLQVGERIAVISEESPCKNVIRAEITTAETSFSDDVNPPYSGNAALDRLNNLFNPPSDGWQQ